jgi:hypothetical protein
VDRSFVDKEFCGQTGVLWGVLWTDGVGTFTKANLRLKVSVSHFSQSARSVRKL